MDCSPPGSPVSGILQARTLEWVAFPFSRGSSWCRDRTLVSHTAGGFFTIWAARELTNSNLSCLPCARHCPNTLLTKALDLRHDTWSRHCCHPQFTSEGNEPQWGQGHGIPRREDSHPGCWIQSQCSLTPRQCCLPRAHQACHPAWEL